MTTRDFIIKWGAYALALLPVWILESFVLGWIPFPGAGPMLLPLAAVAVAVLEGSVAGAGYGLAVGVLCDAVYVGGGGSWTIGMALLGTAAGTVARYGLRQNLAGCLLCSLGGLVVIDGVRMAWRLLRGVAAFSAMAAVALPEIGWSMLFVFPIYALYLWVFNRVPKRTVL